MFLSFQWVQESYLIMTFPLGLHLTLIASLIALSPIIVTWSLGLHKYIFSWKQFHLEYYLNFPEWNSFPSWDSEMFYSPNKLWTIDLVKILEYIAEVQRCEIVNLPSPSNLLLSYVRTHVYKIPCPVPALCHLWSLYSQWLKDGNVVQWHIWAWIKIVWVTTVKG